MVKLYNIAHTQFNEALDFLSISKEYHSCILLYPYSSKRLAVVLLVEQVEILAGCSVLAGTGTPQWAYWLGRTVRPGGPPLVGLPVGQVEGPTSLTGSAGWGLPSASGTPVSAKMDIFRGGNPKRRWRHHFRSEKNYCKFCVL